MTNAVPIALVGHCGPDMMMLATAMRRISPESPIMKANDASSLEQALASRAVLLVNRVLDGEFGDAVGDRGIALISSLAQRNPALAMLLISNYEESQEQAEAAGAMPGFGKSQLYDEATASRVQAALRRAGA